MAIWASICADRAWLRRRLASLIESAKASSAP